MGRLSDMLKSGKIIFISGPYGTEVAERKARDMVEHPQKASGAPDNKYIGAGCSALITEEGQVYLLDIAFDYLTSVPKEQALVITTPSFRLAKQTLEAAASVRGEDPQLPSMGLELCLDSINIVQQAVEKSGRLRDNTLVAMSIGPPFDCYKGEDTPSDVDNKYLPQTFAAIRFGHPLDYLMFETVPSLEAAIGAARAFAQAHQELDIEESTANFKNMGTITYMRSILSKVKYFGYDATKQLASSFDPAQNKFFLIKPDKEYVLSLCLDKDGKLNGMPLEDAMNRLYKAIEDEGLYQPAGVGINCNSPEVTGLALSQLSPQNLSMVIGIHPNASSENDPRQYAHMTKQQAIPTFEFASQVSQLATKYGLRIVGGCCGTNPETMRVFSQTIPK